nr:hypothetical protein [Tanacetum cinerariifolium]
HLMMNCKLKSIRLQCLFWKMCKAYSPEDFNMIVIIWQKYGLGEKLLKPPLMDKKPVGRPKSTARIRSQGEEPVPVRCERCIARGHNQNSCRETIPQKKAKTSATRYSQQEHYYSQQEHYYSQQAMPFSFEAVDLNDP